MTSPIPEVAPMIQAMGDGRQRVFCFPFPIFWDSDLEVRIGSAIRITGFTVFGAGSSKGGAVAFAAAPAMGSRVTLRRKHTHPRDGADRGPALGHAGEPPLTGMADFNPRTGRDRSPRPR